MIIQNIGGGLGNQIMIYVFARFLARRNPRQVMLFDDIFFPLYGTAIDSGYRLESIFGVQLNFLSTYFNHDIWEDFLSLEKKQALLSPVPRLFYDAGLPMAVVADRNSYTGFPGLTIFPDQLASDMWKFPYDNIYCYYSWWTENYWFEQDQEENRKELTFPRLTDSKNLKYADQINECDMSVGIHVRRGDYVRLGWSVPADKYRSACQKVMDRFPDASFFVFSNELDWCKAHAGEMGLDLAAHTTFVEENDSRKDYVDMQLMSMCRGLIHSETSSFSRAAGWLTRDLEFEVKIK